MLSIVRLCSLLYQLTNHISPTGDIISNDDGSDIEDGSSVTSLSEDKDEMHEDDELNGVHELDIEETDFAYGEITPRQPKANKMGMTKAVLSPGTNSFRDSLNDMINGFSSAICKYIHLLTLTRTMLVLGRSTYIYVLCAAQYLLVK